MAAFAETFRVLTEPPLFPPLMACLGLVFGGFVTVAADRLAREAAAEDAGEEIPEDTGLWYPPSKCEGCGRKLSALDKIPVLGWFLVRGRCKSCGYKVPFLLPLSEAATGLAFLGAALMFPWGQAVAYAAMLWFLIALTAADFRFKVLPDRLTLPLLWIGLLAAAFGLSSIGPQDAIFGAAFGYGAFWLVREAYWWLRGKMGLGGGDLKLLAALGAWTGWWQLPYVALLGAMIALLAFGVFRLFRLFPGEHKPFGPFLAVAGGIMALWPEGLSRAVEWLYAVMR
jgi:leader peptidase (prepilin peptidase)/N-methyltransferase